MGEPSAVTEEGPGEASGEAADAGAMTEEGVRRVRARGRWITCLMVGHFVSYPLMFVAAVAGMSVSIVLQEAALLAADKQMEAANGTQRWLMDRVGLAANEAAAFELIMQPVMVALLVILVIAHVAAIPWANRARAAALGEVDEAVERKARKQFVVATGGTTLVVLIAGAIGWVVIFAR